MKVSLSFTDFQRATKEFQRQAGGDRQLEHRETALFLPPALGQGYIRGVHLRDGLDLFVYEFDLKQDLILDFSQLSSRFSLVDLTFCLTGWAAGTIPGLKPRLDVSAGQMTFSTIPNAAGTTELLAGRKITVVSLAIAPAVLLTLMERNLSALPADWQQRLQLAASTPSYLVDQTAPEMARLLQLILHCPHQGVIRKIYLEGKALELIALYFAQLSSGGSGQSTSLKRKDVASIRQAKHILLTNVANPPALNVLAQQVGISERKLQQGFQQLFGTTVFGVLHDYRMEQARQLIEADQMTIGAIANAVGIAHRGYFAAAFKRKFGSTPRAYLKQMGR
ncbi:MAG: AraC family transcriptional regulator [Cyanobacteria bacterium P01_A01_bin.135]